MRVMARDAIKILRDIRSTLADLGIPRNDPDLISLWKKGLDEISKRTEENDEGGLDV
mgnify:FL=1